MVASTTQIRDLLESNWSLTGELSNTVIGVPPNDMSIVVKFFDRAQVKGNETPKAITVQKINKEGNENVVQHPNFNEVRDTYEITVHYRIRDVIADAFSEFVEDVQDMADEVTRILKLAYDPSTGTGNFFRVIREWVKEDVYDGNQPEFRRRLFFSLSKITSSDISTVFTGFGGVLVFDTSASEGDNKPAQDYTYVAVKNISFDEGYSEIPYLTKDQSKGKGVPHLRRGTFSGSFSALMYAEKNNMLGSTIEKLQNIYKTQNSPDISGQIAEVVFLHSNSDSNSAFAWIDGTSYLANDRVTFENKVYEANAPHTATIGNQPPGSFWDLITETLTTTSFLKINRILLNDAEEDLVTFVVKGVATRPTLYGVA